MKQVVELKLHVANLQATIDTLSSKLHKLELENHHLRTSNTTTKSYCAKETQRSMKNDIDNEYHHHELLQKKNDQ